eukprot:6381737-Prymnesium_polylepis.1
MMNSNDVAKERRDGRVGDGQHDAVRRRRERRRNERQADGSERARRRRRKRMLLDGDQDTEIAYGLMQLGSRWEGAATTAKRTVALLNGNEVRDHMSMVTRASALARAGVRGGER